MAVFYAMAVAAVLLLYRLLTTPWVRLPFMVLLALPLLSIVYGIALSL